MRRAVKTRDHGKPGLHCHFSGVRWTPVESEADQIIFILRCWSSSPHQFGAITQAFDHTMTKCVINLACKTSNRIIKGDFFLTINHISPVEQCKESISFMISSFGECTGQRSLSVVLEYWLRHWKHYTLGLYGFPHTPCIGEKTCSYRNHTHGFGSFFTVVISAENCLPRILRARPLTQMVNEYQKTWWCTIQLAHVHFILHCRTSTFTPPQGPRTDSKLRGHPCRYPLLRPPLSQTLGREG